MANVDAPSVEVVVVVSPAAGQVRQISLKLPVGASVRDALLQSGVHLPAPDGDTTSLGVGVWGQRKTLDHLLRDRDRVEIYRPLLIDPKEARRRRQRATCNRRRSRP